MLPIKVLHRKSWASVVSAHVESEIPSDVLLQSTLAAHAEMLVRVGSFLKRAGPALEKLSLVSVVLHSTPMKVDVGGSVENKVAGLYGCFSPQAVDNSQASSTLPTVVSTTEGETILVVVPQVMPELEVLCASSYPPLSTERMTIDMQTIMCEGRDSILSCEPRLLNSCGRLDVTSAPDPPPQVHKSNALLAKNKKKLIDLLATVDAISPGFGRAIACLMMGTTFNNKCKEEVIAPVA
ncbi:hypothetical protein D1007_03123 [Hordeum vulgare]|nr:hypothetical protein D1007_03123 [Hordeum vulgare]